MLFDRIHIDAFSVFVLSCTCIKAMGRDLNESYTTTVGPSWLPFNGLSSVCAFNLQCIFEFFLSFYNKIIHFWQTSYKYCNLRTNSPVAKNRWIFKLYIIFYLFSLYELKTSFAFLHFVSKTCGFKILKLFVFFSLIQTPVFHLPLTDPSPLNLPEC